MVMVVAPSRPKMTMLSSVVTTFFACPVTLVVRGEFTVVELRSEKRREREIGEL